MTNIEPMLCERIIPTEVDKYLSNPEYIYEEKYDGTRCLAIVQDGKATLQNRRGDDITARFPEVVEVFRKMKDDGVLDGELVILNGNGKPNFNLLQQRTHLKDPLKIKLLAKSMPATLIAFDILEYEGESIREMPLTERKRILELYVVGGLALTARAQPALYQEHWGSTEWTDGMTAKTWMEHIIADGGEGLVAKRKNSVYVDGGRNLDWIKLKKFESTDCVVVGFTQGEGKRAGVLGALVLAQRDTKTNEIRYVGKAGTGFDDKMLKEITEQLQAIATSENKNITFRLGNISVAEPYTPVQLKYVAEVRFMERTKDGIMRHPVFLRLRDDKKIEDCVM